MTTWDILVCSITHRTGLLCELLDELGRQVVPGVGVHVFRDNLETGYGAKCQALMDSSTADYVSFIDDDDNVAPTFVADIVAALDSQPDYVGFRVRYTEDGVLQMPVYHTLRYGGWQNTPEALYRDIVHFNPIRRTIASSVPWVGENGADATWAAGVRAGGQCRNEVFIDKELHYYQHRPHDTFLAPRSPLPNPPARPDYPWVTWL